VPKLKALEEVPIATKADQLRAVWPLVEQKLAGGASHAAVLGALNQDGYSLTERTYKSYVYRFRKERRQASGTPAVQGSHAVAAFTTQPAAVVDARALGKKRPRTFDYDPRGIPDLLK
jgi:hypothetical protein